MDDYYEKLREAIINELEAMYFAGGIGSALIDISRVENADDEELEEIANELGISIDNKTRTRNKKKKRLFNLFF